MKEQERGHKMERLREFYRSRVWWEKVVLWWAGLFAAGIMALIIVGLVFDPLGVLSIFLILFFIGGLMAFMWTLMDAESWLRQRRRETLK